MLGTRFHDYPYSTDSNILFLFLVTNVLIVAFDSKRLLKAVNVNIVHTFRPRNKEMVVNIEESGWRTICIPYHLVRGGASSACLLNVNFRGIVIKLKDSFILNPHFISHDRSGSDSAPSSPYQCLVLY